MNHRDMIEIFSLSTKSDDIKAIKCCVQSGHKLIMHSMSSAGKHSLHVFNKTTGMRYDIDYEPIGGDLGLTDGYIVNEEVSKLFFAEKNKGEAMKLTIVDFWMQETPMVPYRLDKRCTMTLLYPNSLSYIRPAYNRTKHAYFICSDRVLRVKDKQTWTVLYHRWKLTEFSSIKLIAVISEFLLWMEINNVLYEIDFTRENVVHGSIHKAIK